MQANQLLAARTRAFAAVSLGLSMFVAGCAESEQPHDPSAPHAAQRSEVDAALDVALLALDRVDDLSAAAQASPEILGAIARLRDVAQALGGAGQGLHDALELDIGREAPLGRLSVTVGQVTPRLRGLARAVRAASLDPSVQRDLLAAITTARVAVRSLDLAVGELHGDVNYSDYQEAGRTGGDRNGPLPGTPFYILDEGHIDPIDIAYEDGFEVSIHDESVDPDVERDPATTIMVVKSAAKLTVPDSRFAFLGAVGAPVWILPEAQPDAQALGILWPGMATEELGAGVFVGDKVRVRLRQVNGPNGFAVFFSPSDETTPPSIIFDSEDGLPDSIELPVGTHTHANWAFESAGQYRVKYDVVGRLAGVPGQPTVRSSVTTLKFVVKP